MEKKNLTLIAGASDNPGRYAYLAAQTLMDHGYDFVPIGIRKGDVFGKEILLLKDNPSIPPIDTVTLYVGPKNQPAWIDFILKLKPRRVIFNPGTENDEFQEILQQENIETEEACTLVLLRSGQY